MHRMHHADLDFDATTGLRFHPVEILISMGIKLAVVAALGPPAVAVLLFEVILNATALFNHANIDLPRPVDRVLRGLPVLLDRRKLGQLVTRLGIAPAGSVKKRKTEYELLRYKPERRAA